MVKKLFIKAVVAVLLVSMMLTLAACGGGTTTTTTKNPGGTTTSNGGDDDTPITTTTGGNTSTDKPTQLDGIKEETAGNEVTFLYVEGGNGTYTADSIWADESLEGLDDVADATIQRNTKIEEELGITIDPYPADGVGISGLQEFSKAYFDAGDPTIDVYCGYQYYDISFATSGNLVNLNTITNSKGEKIIDITKDYWATNYINSVTYNNNMYWVTGDLALRYVGGIYCTFVNSSLYDTYVKAAYENKTIYQIVNDGKWTLDTMLDMASHSYIDDGDKIVNDTDTFGIVYETCDVIDGMAFGCKVDFGKKTTVNGKDEITVSILTSTTADTFMQKLDEMYKASYAWNAGNSDSQNMMPIFAEGRALFAVNKVYMAGVWLNEMDEGAFAIVPTPKLTETASYATGVHDSCTIFGISKFSDCRVAAAATLELMAYYSSQLVAPVFYDKVMKGRFTRDDDAALMIDLIRQGFDSDFVAAWSNSLDNVVHTFRNASDYSSFKKTLNIKKRTWPNLLVSQKGTGTGLLEKLDAAALEE